MNKIMCFVTGGHRYKDSNLQNYIDDNDIVHFTNCCVKCGKEYTCKIPFANLLGDFYEKKGNKSCNKDGER